MRSTPHTLHSLLCVILLLGGCASDPRSGGGLDLDAPSSSGVVLRDLSSFTFAAAVDECLQSDCGPRAWSILRGDLLDSDGYERARADALADLQPLAASRDEIDRLCAWLGQHRGATIADVPAALPHDAQDADHRRAQRDGLITEAGREPTRLARVLNADAARLCMDGRYADAAERAAAIFDLASLQAAHAGRTWASNRGGILALACVTTRDVIDAAQWETDPHEFAPELLRAVVAFDPSDPVGYAESYEADLEHTQDELRRNVLMDRRNEWLSLNRRVCANLASVRARLEVLSEPLGSDGPRKEGPSR